MNAAFRVLIGVALSVALVNVPALGQPRRLRSLPRTGRPTYTWPYYGYRYTYRPYYAPPYRSVPGMGVPYTVPNGGVPPYPPYYSTWRLGITGVDWPGIGVRIATIEPSSPAELMGIDVADVIVRVNGSPIRSMLDLRNAVAASGGYVRVLVLDNRTGTYMWHNGSLY